MNCKSFFVLLLGVLAGFVVVVRPAFAQAPQFTPREESPEEFPPAPGREEAFYSCTACHNFQLVAAQGQTRRQWEDTINLMVERHGMPALEGNDRKLVLDYLETAFPPRARSPGGWQNPFLNR
jgi:mono/diheme cytochrome c family protein